MNWSTYSWTPPTPARRITTSRTELLQLGVAYLVLTVCLLLVFSGNTFLGSGFAPPGFHGISVALVVVSALASLTGFVAHEMAHKISAQRQGFWAEFRTSPYGLAVALMTSILGFIVAAPGATVVGGINAVDRRSWGRTSLAGPLTNLGFSVVFYAASVVPYLYARKVLIEGTPLFDWLLVLAFINAWFGTFNLFPFGVLDGRKVLAWSRQAWAGAISLTLVAMVFTVLALYFLGGPLLSR